MVTVITDKEIIENADMENLKLFGVNNHKHIILYWNTWTIQRDGRTGAYGYCSICKRSVRIEDKKETA